MISLESLEKLGKQYQMGVFPNIVREYFQHVFLAELYRFSEAEKLLFKGGTALRIIYGSPRFSEDLDFSLFNVLDRDIKHFVESLFVKTLAEIEKMGIQVKLGDRFGATSGGYLGLAVFQMFDFQATSVEINISTRSDAVGRGEVETTLCRLIRLFTCHKMRLWRKKFLELCLSGGNPVIFMIFISLCAKVCFQMTRKRNCLK